MMKRFLALVLCLCMTLTLLPTTVFAAGELRDSTNVTVTFDSDGGSAVEPQSVPQGHLVQRPADPIKDGYGTIPHLNWRSILQGLSKRRSKKSLFSSDLCGTNRPAVNDGVLHGMK